MYLGIEIGGTKLQVVLGGKRADILERRRFAVDQTKGAGGIRRRIEAAVAELSSGRKIKGVGVGFGGPIDWRTGIVDRSHQINGWRNFHLARWLHDLTGARVTVDNDVNAAALAEATLGAGRKFNLVFCINPGSGVGGGLAVGRKIYHGARPGECEIGHVRLDRSGVTVEQRCSGWAIDRRIRRLVAIKPTGPLARLVIRDSGNEARHLAAALRQRDQVAQRLVNELAEDLAFGLSHVVHLLHPEIIVIGGGLSHVGEPLRAGVEKSLRGFLMKAFLPGPRVALTELKDDMVTRGALLLAETR